MMFLSALALCFLAMLCFCMAMPRHFQQFWQREIKRPEQFGLRALGVLWLIASWLACAYGWDSAQATVAWLGLLSLTGFIMLLIMPYQARVPLAAGVIAIVIAPLGWLL